MLFKVHDPSNMMMFIHPALETEVLALVQPYDLDVKVRKGEL